MRTPDGPFLMVFQPIVDVRNHLEAALGELAHLKFASSERELRDNAKIFSDAQGLVIICLEDDACLRTDLDAVFLSREIYDDTRLPIIISKDRFDRRYSTSDASMHCVPTAELAIACHELLVA